MLTAREKKIVINLLEDKIDIFERHIRKFNKDYNQYKNRRNWIPGITLGSDDSDYVKELERQIELEEKKISDYKHIIEEICSG